jgi:hypothetical protein
MGIRHTKDLNNPLRRERDSRLDGYSVLYNSTQRTGGGSPFQGIVKETQVDFTSNTTFLFPGITIGFSVETDSGSHYMKGDWDTVNQYPSGAPLGPYTIDFGGGGGGTYPGGNYAGFFVGPVTQSNSYLISGGSGTRGGGAGGYPSGGGGNPSYGSGGPGPAQGGGGGTQVAGGSPGAGAPGYGSGSVGSALQGGVGGPGDQSNKGGSGGGGYWGGGGGGGGYAGDNNNPGAGGGGGSSYINPIGTLVDNGPSQIGVRVRIKYREKL